MQQNDTLEPKHKKFIACLLTNATMQSAADCADISRKTAYRWLDLPQVQQELEKRTETALQQATAFTADLQGQVASELWTIAKNETVKDSDKIAALRTLAGMSLPLYQQTALTKLLRKMEQRLNEFETGI